MRLLKDKPRGKTHHCGLVHSTVARYWTSVANLRPVKVERADYSKLVNPLERSTGNRSPSQAVGQGTLRSR